MLNLQVSRLLILVAWFPSGAVFQGALFARQELVSVSAADKCSIFHIALSYAEAIQSGDVLVLQREFFDGVHHSKPENGHQQLIGGTLETVTLTRTIFDDRGDRALVAIATKSEWLELAAVSEPSKGRSRQKKEWGYLLDRKGKKYLVKSGKNLLEVPWRDDLILQDDPRVAGLSGDRFGPFGMSQKAFLTFATGDTLIDFKDTGEYVELRMDFGRDEGSKANDVRHFYFDKKNHLPNRSQRYMEFDKGGQTQPRDSHFEWKERSGIFVPDRVKSVRYSSFEGPNREQWHGNVSAECYIDWLSINEPIPEATFTGEDLKGQDKFADLIDPIKHNAKSILEFLDKEKQEQEPLKIEGNLSNENNR